MNKTDQIDIYSRSPDFRKKKCSVIAVIIAAAVLICTVGGLFGKQFYDQYHRKKYMSSVLNTETFYDGIYVEEVKLGGKTMDQAKADVKTAEPNLKNRFNVNIVYKDKSWKLTEKDIDFKFNTDLVLKKAYSYARTGEQEDRFKKITELKTNPKKFNIISTVNKESLKSKLKQIVKEIAYPPVDAKVASFNTKTASFSYADGKNGLEVYENKLFNQIVGIIEGEKTGKVTVHTKVVPFKTSIAQVKSHLQKLGTYSTTSTNNANGNHNMNKALKSINGTCVPAGKIFSFHGTIGNSNKANGYLPGGAILKGKFIKSYGGGICQASTTVYGAALRSNMKIVKRFNHTIPSSYCPIGQDAAVSYPELDFKFQNPTKYPIYIVSGMKGRVLTVTLYGFHSPDYDTIVVTSKKTQTIPAPAEPKYSVDNTLKKGVIKFDCKARQGARAQATRVFYKNGAVVRKEILLPSYYRPMPAFYSIGRGTNVKENSSVSSKVPSKTPSQKPNSSNPPSSSSNVQVCRNSKIVS